MKNLILLVFLFIAASTVFAESYTTYRTNNFDLTIGSDNYYGTGYRVGNYYYYSDNKGNNHIYYNVADPFDNRKNSYINIGSDCKEETNYHYYNY